MSKKRPAGASRPGFRIRPAERNDASDFARLIHLAAPDELTPATTAYLLGLPAQGYLTHSPCVCLTAELPDGTVAGALLAQPPAWMHEFAAADAEALTGRVGLIVAVAADPAFRRQGIGSALIRAAERRYRRAGFGLVMLYHEPALDGFYQELGFSSGPALMANLPHSLLLLGKEDHLLTGLKPLDPQVRLVDV
ncbi:GNAT family N-acetyltransferase, partial [Streptacidiphilus jiangxiensis]